MQGQSGQRSGKPVVMMVGGWVIVDGLVWAMGLLTPFVILLLLLALAVIIFLSFKDAPARQIANGALAAAPQVSAAASSSIVDDLSRLADSRDQGALTEQEFQGKKSKLLGSGL